MNSIVVISLVVILLALLVSRILLSPRSKASNTCSKCGHTNSKLVRVLKGPSPGPSLEHSMCLQCVNKLAVAEVVSELDHGSPLANDIAENGEYLYELERSLVSVISHNSKYYLTFVSDDWFGQAKTYEISRKSYQLIVDNQLQREEILSLFHVH